MSFSGDEIVRMVEHDLMAQWSGERRKLDHIDRWARWEHDRPHAPRQATQEYQQLLEESGGYISTFAAAPLLNGDTTTGTLGFVKSGDREWLPTELSAVEAIASLLAQVQGRIAAEDQLRFLADHDDLTGVLNRRAQIGRASCRERVSSPV